MTNRDEKDLRLEIFDTLLTTPHRALDDLAPLHREMADLDPLFYMQLAAWYHDTGDVRDHKEMFVVTLSLSEFEGHRDVGLALLRELPPYQVARVVDFIHGRTVKRRVPTEPKSAKQPPSFRVEETKTGLGKNVPRSMRTEVARYLRERETDADWFDSSVLIARRAMKRLYALLHVKPGERAQQILFEKTPPRDSRLFALRQLSKAETPEEQARVITEHKIPYRVAATVVKSMAPPVLRALVERMTPQEAINNLGALKKRGALQDPQVQALIDQKLADAGADKRVSAFKAEKAIEAAGVSAEVREKLERVADEQIKSKGSITRPTALLVDKSASMQEAIELGKRIGAMLSTVCTGGLYVYAFDTMAYEITPAGENLADWERAFRGIRASGGTSCGIALKYMIKKQQSVEQIILITDEGENNAPFLVPTLQEYREKLKAAPHICFVKTPGATDHLEQRCRQDGVEHDVFRFEGDYYALPNLIPLLAQPSKMELLMEIMDYPLPVRQTA